MWKNLPTRLKGMIIGLVVGLIGSMFSHFFIPPIGEALIPTEGPFKFLLLPFVLVGVIFSLSGIFGCNHKSEPCFSEVVFGYIITIILFSLIGTLIGWIVGKITSKRRTSI